ncbi:MAG: sensor histidine kinase [Planctomycetota bacterium]|nr:MAG: sensor histidine kinase [Planctomycetota bacterium]
MTIQQRFGVLLGLVAVCATLGFGAVLWTVDLYQRETVAPVIDANRTLRRLNTLAGALDAARGALTDDPGAWTDVARRLRHVADALVDEANTSPGIGVGGLRSLRSTVADAADAVAASVPTDPASVRAAETLIDRAELLAMRIEAQTLDAMEQTTAHGSVLRGQLNSVLLSTLSVVLLILALGVLLVRRWVLAPVNRLRIAAERFADEDYSHRVRSEKDPSEFTQLAEAFNRMIEQLAESRRRQVERERLAAAGAMVRRLAHNIRNPLAGIRSLAELTRLQSPDDSETRELQGRIISTIDRFERWLADLVRAASDPRPAPEPHLVRDWLRDVITPHRAHAEARGVRIDLDVESAPESAVFDGQLLEHALISVLFNAIEASPTGQAVSVRTGVNGARWRLHVLDRGPGIPESDAERVFRPDFTTKPGGHGLGLAAAAQTASRHGGRLYLARPRTTGDGRPGGAEFIFDLPLAPPMMEPEGGGHEPVNEDDGGQHPSH